MKIEISHVIKIYTNLLNHFLTQIYFQHLKRIWQVYFKYHRFVSCKTKKNKPDFSHKNDVVNDILYLYFHQKTCNMNRTLA